MTMRVLTTICLWLLTGCTAEQRHVVTLETVAVRVGASQGVAASEATTIYGDVTLGLRIKSAPTLTAQPSPDHAHR